MNEQQIATIMGFPNVEAMTKHQERIQQQLQEAAEIQEMVAALRQLQSSGDQFFGFAGQDLLCDGNYRVSLVIGLTSEGFVTTAALCGGYPVDVPMYERDRSSNFIVINFPPRTDLDRDTDAFPQNTIHNKETGGWVMFSDPSPTHNGWQVDIEINFKDPGDKTTVHTDTEAIVIDERTLNFWPQFLTAVVR